MTTITDSTLAPAKKPYSRPMTEKRKEQNRRSQKVYREKLKKKLEDLEERVEKNTQLKQISSLEAVVRDIDEHVSSGLIKSLTGNTKTNTIDLNAAFVAAGDLVLPTDTSLPTFELGVRSRDPSRSSTASPNNADAISQDDAAIPKLLAVDVYAPPDPRSPNMRSLWPVPVSTYWEFYTPPTAKQRRIPYNSSFISVESTPSLTPSPFSRTPSTYFSPTGIPSLYLNHLRLPGESAFSATLAIATSLGITHSAYVNDHPSPFSRTHNDGASFNYKSIPKDLRPTPEQMSIAHCSYLDCIVFPRFRSNAIVLASRGELDHFSLFLDLMHDGLVCWGSEHASQRTGRNMRDGVAWSKRSWEARPWFLRKWGWILAVDPHVPGIGLLQGKGVCVDEEEHDPDAMFEGSRWWRSMRGESVEEQEDLNLQHVEEHGEILSRHKTCNVGLRDAREFAEIGTLWPNQFDDQMARKLESPGMSASCVTP